MEIFLNNRRLTACFFTLATLFTLMPAAMAVVPWTYAINTNNIVVVTNAPYGAVGDNATDNTTAIQSAINQAAKGGKTNNLYGGTVLIPPGTDAYLCGPLNMSNNVNLQVDGGAILRILPLTSYPMTWVTNGSGYWFTNTQDFISGKNLTNIAISGFGAIDGQGAQWWPWANTNNADRPRMISFSGGNRTLIQNITLSNSPMFHLALGGGNTTVEGVIIRAPSSSHNTDACDVNGTNIVVQNCNISVGDDDFTCSGGTSDVLLTNNVYGTGHGVSIGSYTSPGVSNFLVINCSFTGTDNGIRLKSQRGRGGLIQNLTYCNLNMTNVGWPLLVYSYYEYGLGTLTGVDPTFAANVAATNYTALTSTTPIWQNITFSNINATMPAGRPPLMVWGLPEALASNIVFRAVNITSSSSLDPGVYNATNIQFIDCNFNLPSGVNDVQFYNAGLIFSNTPATSTASNLWIFDGLTTNGYGNTLQLCNALGTLKNTNALDNGPLTLAASTFTISNNLNLSPATVLNYTLGTNTTKLAVVGSLTLGGTNNISGGPGFTNGTFTLMTYTGTLSGAVPTLGTTPAGYTYAFNTNTAGQVKLMVSLISTAPSTPTNLVAIATNGSVALSWSPSATATNYYVKRSTTSGSGYVTLAGVTVTNYTDVQVTNGTTYYYVVSASNSGGESGNSTEVSATPVAPPAAPTGLVATAGNAQAMLSWNAASGATSYNLKRATVNGGPYSIITSLTATSFTDTNLVNSTVYYYVVSALNAGGEGSNSAQVSVTPQAPSYVIVTTNVFTDTFGSSTLNGTSSPTTNSTSYDIASTKNASSTYSFITSGSKLRLGLSTATSSGFVEAQALFTTNPVTLATVGDYIKLTYTFTNVSGTLLAGATNSLIVQGLFNSSGSAPVAGTLANAGLNTTTGSTYATNNCANWMGYVAQISNTNGYASKMFTRPLQNGAGTTSANQDLLFNSVGSGAFNNPSGTQIGSLETVNFLLTAGATYTISYSIALTASGIFTITNNLYSGADTTGTLIFSQTNTTTVGTYLTNSFDSLSIGVRNSGFSFNPTMDISQISVTSTLTVAANNNSTPPPAPTNLLASATNLLINLKWNAVNGATNYSLKRGTTNGGAYPTVFSLTATNYADANVTNAVNYFYVVTALGAGGESTNSLQASAIPLPSNQPTNIAMQVVGSQMQLSWPQDHLGWRLQIQTNNLSNGLSTNWATVANSTNFNSTSVPLVTTNASVFLRLVYP